MYTFFENQSHSNISSLMKKIIISSQGVAHLGTIPSEHQLQFIQPEQIEIIAGSIQVYDVIVREIKKAKKQILIQTFVWIADTQIIKDIREALCSLKDKIDVFILVDQLDVIARGAFLGEFNYKRPKHDPESLGLHDLPDNIRLHIGTYVHNSPAANHNKTILIDESVIITGANFQHENYGDDAFYDAGMLIPTGAAQLIFWDFFNMWDQRTNKGENKYARPICPELTKDMHSESKCPILYVTNIIQLMPAILPFYQAKLPPNPLSNAYLAAINNAQTIIRIAVPNLNSNDIMLALAHFINKKQGNIELLMSKNFNNHRERFYGGTNQNTVERLMSMISESLRDHLKIRWFRREANYRMHMKFMAIDDQIVIYGSANLDYVSLHNCHEGNLVVDSKAFTQRATKELFLDMFRGGEPVIFYQRKRCCALL